MYLHFTSDGSVTSTGFSAAVNTTTPPSPLYVLDTSSTVAITTAAHPNVTATLAATYTPGVNCSVIVSSGYASSSVQWALSAFSTRRGVDYVYLYDGPSASSPLLGALTGGLSSLAKTVYVRDG